MISEELCDSKVEWVILQFFFHQDIEDFLKKCLTPLFWSFGGMEMMRNVWVHNEISISWLQTV